MIESEYLTFCNSLTEEEKIYVSTSFKDFKEYYEILNKYGSPCTKENLCIGLTDPFKKRDYLRKKN